MYITSTAFLRNKEFFSIQKTDNNCFLSKNATPKDIFERQVSFKSAEAVLINSDKVLNYIGSHRLSFHEMSVMLGIDMIELGKMLRTKFVPEKVLNRLAEISGEPREVWVFEPTNLFHDTVSTEKPIPKRGKERVSSNFPARTDRQKGRFVVLKPTSSSMELVPTKEDLILLMWRERISPAELSKRIGIKAEQLWDIIKGKTKITIETANLLVEKYGSVESWRHNIAKPVNPEETLSALIHSGKKRKPAKIKPTHAAQEIPKQPQTVKRNDSSSEKKSQDFKIAGSRQMQWMFELLFGKNENKLDKKQLVTVLNKMFLEQIRQKTFGELTLQEKLRLARIEAGLYQRDVDKLLDWPNLRVRNIEESHTEIKAYQLYLLGYIYKKPLKWLLGLSEDKCPPSMLTEAGVKDLNLILGRNLKKARELAGLTGDEAGAAIQKDATAIYKYEKAQRYITAENLLGLIKKYEIKENDIEKLFEQTSFFEQLMQHEEILTEV